MALALADRVKETTTITGTGTISLAGAVAGFQSFVSSVGDGNTTYYALEDSNGVGWEVGLGTVTDASPDTLSRATILDSSVQATATLTFGDTEFDDVNNGTLTLIDIAGLSKTYIIKNDYAASAATEFNAGGARGSAAENLAQVVESSNGHNGTIYAMDSSNVRFSSGGYDFSDGVVNFKQATGGAVGNTTITTAVSFDDCTDVNIGSAFTGGGGSAITLSSGTHTVFVTYPASKSVHLDADGNLSHTVDVSSDTNLAASTGITLTGDTLTTNDGQIVHDSLSGFVANEHIDHSGVSIATGTGLSGGGDLTSTRTLSVDASQTQITSVGTITTGTWQGTTIAVDQGGTGATSLSNLITLGTHTTGNYVTTIAGTTNEIEVSGSGSETAAVTIGLPDNVTISGNLTVSGDTTTVNTATLSVEDPLIILASGNSSSDAVDVGFYGLMDPTGSQDVYAGLFRDASDAKWKLFDLLQAAPTTTVNTSGTGYDHADLQVGSLYADDAVYVGGTNLTSLYPNVTLVTSSHDYLSISTQAITLGPIDLAADVTGTLPASAVQDKFLRNDASDTTTGTITAGGFTTTGTWTFDESTSGTIGITTIQDSGSSFSDNDTSL